MIDGCTGVVPPSYGSDGNVATGTDFSEGVTTGTLVIADIHVAIIVVTIIVGAEGMLVSLVVTTTSLSSAGGAIVIFLAPAGCALSYVSSR